MQRSLSLVLSVVNARSVSLSVEAVTFCVADDEYGC